jgi:hypothetical protein
MYNMKREIISIIIIFTLSVAPFSGRAAGNAKESPKGSPKAATFQIKTPLQGLAVNPETDLYVVSRAFQPLVQLYTPAWDGGVQDRDLLFVPGTENEEDSGFSNRVGISDGGWILALGCLVYGIVMRRRMT